VALLALLGVAVGVVLHPLQFTMVQLLEGYWGLGRLAVRLRVALTFAHLNRRNALMNLGDVADGISEAAAQADQDTVWSDTVRDEADRLKDRYPAEHRQVMPTRLGNMLRTYEARAGAPYGLTGPAVVPYLAMVAPPDQLAYLNDQRSMLDLAVRTSLTAWLAFGASVLFLWDDGAWLLVALVPYAAAYLCYRGSVISAQIYGVALCSLVALNRFALYDQLRLRPVRDSAEEATQNTVLDAMLSSWTTTGVMQYQNPPAEDKDAAPAGPETPA
jgi:hypothetical protein